MKKIKTINPLFHHPALGKLLSIVFDDGSTAQIFEEWFFDLFPSYECNIDSLIGIQLDNEWIKTHHTEKP